MTENLADEVLQMADDLMAKGEALLEKHPDIACDLMELASTANAYALRSKMHLALVDEAKARVARGEEKAKVYFEVTERLLDLWPDADAYGEGVMAIKAALCEGSEEWRQ